MTGAGALPKYADLPTPDGMRAPSSWGLWGRDDRCGALNLITGERIRAGAAEVRKGAAFPLNLELELPDPPLSERPRFGYRVVPVAAGLGNDDEYDKFNPQASSQIDGFAHVRHPRLGFYNGLEREKHGMHHWARRGIAARGVLADVAAWRERQGRPLVQGTTDPVTPQDLLATLDAQGSAVEPGDVLLIRTGFVTWYRGLGRAEREAFTADLRMPGLAQGAEMAQVLWDLHPSLVAADNMALEVWPPRADPGLLMDDPDAAEERFLHVALIPLLGIPVGELWDLDGLAADCAADGRYSCQVVSAPMNKEGGIATMANALAVK
ncbi:cyclase family protein [Amycolatopsis sp. NPDC006131]|uniref:cyclase family protein n=1 Tax=Amycolatopsis sp. NPDC006131 TaxID=3156731 RepID=UPI0033BD4CA5